jgi:hypothetical protein
VNVIDLEQSFIENHMRQIGPKATAVYLAIRSFCEVSYTGVPISEAELSSMTKLTERSVAIAVKKLRRTGLVKTCIAGGRTYYGCPVIWEEFAVILTVGVSERRKRRITRRLNKAAGTTR